MKISSAGGRRGYSGAVSYGATKWVVRGMTRSAASQLAARGIRVNAIDPSPIDTPLLRANAPELNLGMIEALPLKRLGSQAEVAEVAVFLLAPRSNFVTGAEFCVDSGQSG